MLRDINGNHLLPSMLWGVYLVIWGCYTLFNMRMFTVPSYSFSSSIQLRQSSLPYLPHLWDSKLELGKSLLRNINKDLYIALLVIDTNSSDVIETQPLVPLVTGLVGEVKGFSLHMGNPYMRFIYDRCVYDEQLWTAITDTSSLNLYNTCVTHIVISLRARNETRKHNSGLISRNLWSFISNTCF